MKAFAALLLVTVAACQQAALPPESAAPAPAAPSVAAPATTAATVAAVPPSAPGTAMAPVATAPVLIATPNPTDAALLAMMPAQRAAFLGQGVGCTGKDAFRMGLANQGGMAGNAYWSVRCTDGRESSIEIRPDKIGSAVAIDCTTLAAKSNLRCFKSF